MHEKVSLSAAEWRHIRDAMAVDPASNAIPRPLAMWALDFMDRHRIDHGHKIIIYLPANDREFSLYEYPKDTAGEHTNPFISLTSAMTFLNHTVKCQFDGNVCWTVDRHNLLVYAGLRK